MKQTETIKTPKLGYPPLASTIPSACSRLGIGRTLIYDLIKQGKLRPIKLGTRTLIPESELQQLVASQLEQSS
jgi:excisionase family DNA binding protein